MDISTKTLGTAVLVGGIFIGAFTLHFSKPRALKLKTMAVVAMTWHQAEPSNVAFYEITGIEKGHLYSHYVEAVIKAGALKEDVIETPTTIRFVKSAVVPFLSSFDLAFNWHGFPKEIMDLVHEKSKGRTKLGPVHAIEAIPQAKEWNPEDEALREVLYPHFLRSDRQNRYGCYSIDPYEGLGNSACAEKTKYGTYKRAWYIDMRKASLFAPALGAYRAIGQDVTLFDSVLDRPYYGGATNPLFYPEEEYRAGWSLVLSQFDNDWGNSHVGGRYTKEELPNRWVEHFFRGDNLEARPISEMKGDILLAKSMGVKLALSVQPGRDSVTRWAKTEAEWKELVEFVRASRATGNVLVNNANKYLFWNEGLK